MWSLTARFSRRPRRIQYKVFMAANFVSVDSLEALDALFEESHLTPVVLFKHSNTCGISADLIEQVGAVNANINVIVVQQHRPISNAIAERTGYRHQSPQAFVIKNGKAIYHATHYGINASDIEAGLKS